MEDAQKEGCRSFYGLAHHRQTLRSGHLGMVVPYKRKKAVRETLDEISKTEFYFSSNIYAIIVCIFNKYIRFIQFFHKKLLTL